MRTPPANSGDGRMSDWTAVGAAVTGIKTGEDETPTRPSAGRAPSSAMTQATSRPTRDRDGSASSVTLIRKTVGDFTVGEVLGEGSYSTVRSPFHGIGRKLTSLVLRRSRSSRTNTHRIDHTPSRC